MTLRPNNYFGIRGHEGKPYKVNEVCSAPGCISFSVHAHHLWSRSALRGQPYEYVQLPDGTIIGNRTGLCLKHHEQVTGEIGGYKAHIKYEDGSFNWYRRLGGEELLVGPLAPQPPVGDAEKSAEKSNEFSAAEICPKCGRPLHAHKKGEPGTRRKTKTWALVVPDDAEIGSDLLDEYADEFAEILGFGDASSRLRRYHAVAMVLVWAIQNKDQFVSDILEAARA